MKNYSPESLSIPKTNTSMVLSVGDSTAGSAHLPSGAANWNPPVLRNLKPPFLKGLTPHELRPVLAAR
jgi:hypothetical protein